MLWIGATDRSYYYDGGAVHLYIRGNLQIIAMTDIRPSGVETVEHRAVSHDESTAREFFSQLVDQARSLPTSDPEV